MWRNRARSFRLVPAKWMPTKERRISSITLRSYEDCDRISDDCGGSSGFPGRSVNLHKYPVFRTKLKRKSYVPASSNVIYTEPSFQNRENTWIRINVCILCPTQDKCVDGALLDAFGTMVLEDRLRRKKPYPGGRVTVDHSVWYRHFREVLGRFDESSRVHSTPHPRNI